MKNLIYINKYALVLVALLLSVSGIFSSSHREAPLISNDPLADNVDLYAFKSPDDPNMITIIATYVPLQLPQGGPNYYTFGENIRYEIHVDNDAAVPGDEIIYRFTFDITNEDPTTFFNIRLGQQNQKATYTLERSIDGGNTFQAIITNGIVPPNNIGPRSIEGAAGLNTDYNTLFNNAITMSSTGERVFAGPTDDPFYVDLAGIFDLGDAPRQAGIPDDGLACYNVSAIAIQVPISTLLKSGAPANPTSILDSDYVIGVWASASRPAMTTLSSSDNPSVSGDWVQVSRLGMPLTNEAVIPVGQKDFWNRISPYDEISETTLDEFFYNPELALYMDDDQFGGAVPAFSALRIQTASLGAFDFSNGADGLYGLKGDPALDGTALDDNVFGGLLLPAPGKPRSVDLWPAFHTGVPNVIPYQLATGKNGNPLASGKPFVNNFLPNGGDMLRLNMAVPATPRDDANFSSLGLIQAAAIGLTVAPFNETADLEFIPNMDGFPNGRRLEDDVTRIELQAVSGVVLAAIGLWYDDYDPNSSPSPVTQDLLDVLTYTTGVETNDKAFTASFPYLAQPHSGTGECSGELYFRNAPPLQNPDVKVFVSSNNSGKVGLYGVNETASSMSTFDAAGNDADGIYYDEASDVLYQLNRSDNVVNAYSNVRSSLSNNGAPQLTATSSSDFTNGREIAFLNNKIIVAQDANAANGQVNRFVIYDASPTSITLDKIVNTNINLWGMVAAANDLYAIVDNSSDVAIFRNFLGNNQMATPTEVVTIDGLVRTHGIDYNMFEDVMVLTDVGSGAVADDGAVVIVNNWTSAAADNTVTAAEQIRIAGPATSLGNPVDISYDHDGGLVYVAERANNGGRFLTFDVPTSGGNFAPQTNDFFQGASAVYLADCRPDDNVNPEEVSIVYYSLNECASFASNSSNTDYSEFAPAYPELLSCANVSASNVFRMNPEINGHSCTPGIMSSPAMCVSSMNNCTYNPTSESAVVFNVEIGSTNDAAKISRLEFYEKAPTMFDWIAGPSGLNNYPTLYGVRILLNGVEVYRSEDNPTTNGWTLESFDLSNEDIIIDGTGVLSVQLLGYCTVGNGAQVNAWDLDEIRLFGTCDNDEMLSLRGLVQTESGAAVEEVMLTLESDEPDFQQEYMTTENGEYGFNNLIGEFDYSIRAEKNNDYLNGVSTLDLLIIQRHILGRDRLDSEFKMLAADVNKSNDITALDIFELRKLILGITDETPNGLSWDFIDNAKGYDSTYPDKINNRIVLTKLGEDVDDLNFVAVKYGDVSGDVVSNFAQADIDFRSNDYLTFEVQEQLLIKGQRYQVPVFAKSFDEVLGFQFTIESEKMSIESIIAEGINVQEGSYGQPKESTTTMSWYNQEAVSVEDGNVLFVMNVVAKENGRLSEMIQMTNDVTSIEAYVNDSFEKINAQFRTIDGQAMYANTLYQNSPNPFITETQIAFDLNKSTYAEITIYDMAGRIVFNTTNYYEKGRNNLTVRKEQLINSSGPLFYKLKTNEFEMTKKMLQI